MRSLAKPKRLRSGNRWDSHDLAERIVRTLRVAERVLDRSLDLESIDRKRAAFSHGGGSVPAAKIVSETAMLLYCIAPIKDCDPRIGALASTIATRLLPYARHEEVLGAICMEPSLALDHAVPHLILSRLGYPDHATDALLAETLAYGRRFAPERLAHRRLEQEWLTRVWPIGEPGCFSSRRTLAESQLAKPMDVLGAGRLDVYAFTHAAMYASDFGSRAIVLLRSQSSISADAAASLAIALDSSDFDLAAELAMSWPMLRMPWGASGALGLRVLTHVEDSTGFVPGSRFDREYHKTLTGDEREDYELTTSYHTIYVTGFLYAIALKSDCRPPDDVPASRRFRGAGQALLDLLKVSTHAPLWVSLFAAMAPRKQDAVAPFALAALLRRACSNGDVALICEALEIALKCDLADGPAPLQASALIRRSRMLDRRLTQMEPSRRRVG